MVFVTRKKKNHIFRQRRLFLFFFSILKWKLFKIMEVYKVSMKVQYGGARRISHSM